VEGFHFSTDVRVRFAETDAQRIAHNATYLVWFEVARVAYLDEFTAGYRAFQDAGYEATVVEAHLRYLAPAVFDDVLRIWTRCVDVRGARFRYDYVLARVGDGPRVAEGVKATMKDVPADIQSGTGWVHNTTMLEGVEKAVLRHPLTIVPKPATFAPDPP